MIVLRWLALPFVAFLFWLAEGSEVDVELAEQLYGPPR